MRFEGEGRSLIDQLAASVMGERGGGSLTRLGNCKESLYWIVSVYLRGATSRRVSRFDLQLQSRQEARRSRWGSVLMSCMAVVV